MPWCLCLRLVEHEYYQHGSAKAAAAAERLQAAAPELASLLRQLDGAAQVRPQALAAAAAAAAGPSRAHPPPTLASPLAVRNTLITIWLERKWIAGVSPEQTCQILTSRIRQRHLDIARVGSPFQHVFYRPTPDAPPVTLDEFHKNKNFLQGLQGVGRGGPGSAPAGSVVTYDALHDAIKQLTVGWPHDNAGQG